MKEHPILFSGEMVRAILAGRKTQTRRIIQSPRRNHPEVVFLDHGNGWLPYCSDDGESENCDGMEYPIACPYGSPGDRLWVRETLRIVEHGINRGSLSYCAYAKGLPHMVRSVPEGWVNKKIESHVERAHDALGLANFRVPSIFMPRWACRLELPLIAVKIQRLQEITGKDALAEGCPNDEDWNWRPSYYDPDSGGNPSAKSNFEILWDSLNAARGFSWDTNPWVWALEFPRYQNGKS